MKIPDIKDLVRTDRQARFTRCSDGALWYQILSDDPAALIFDFPVPLDDTDGGTFLSSDKAIFFMRWIRKHLNLLTTASESQASQV